MYLTINLIAIVNSKQKTHRKCLVPFRRRNVCCAMLFLHSKNDRDKGFYAQLTRSSCFICFSLSPLMIEGEIAYMGFPVFSLRTLYIFRCHSKSSTLSLQMLKFYFQTIAILLLINSFMTRMVNKQKKTHISF